MPLSKCLDIADRLSAADNTLLLNKLDQKLAIGTPPGRAQREAAQEVLKELLSQRGEITRLLVEQHPDLLKNARSMFFTNADEFRGVRESARSQTETPEFKRWFGESKVVDAEGKPLVVYHGTTSDFDTFAKSTMGRTDHGTTGQGFYASLDPAVASNYAKGDGGNVMPVYMSIKNPIAFEDAMAEKMRIVAELRAKGRTDEQIESVIGRYLRTSLRLMRYDGVAPSSDPAWKGIGDTWVALHPTQIKSATGNRGTFDPSNPDIRFSGRDVSPLGFYSELARKVESIGPGQAKPGAWKEFMRALSTKGIKSDEVDWSGVNDWLDLQGDRKVPKAELLEYLRGNGVQVDEVVLGEQMRAWYWVERTPSDTRSFHGPFETREQAASAAEGKYEWDVLKGDWVPVNVDQAVTQRLLKGDRAKYEQYTLPGGKNYREVLLTLPGKANMRKQWALLDSRGDTVSVRPDPPNQRWLDLVATAGHSIEEREVADKQANDRSGQYTSSHWGQPNVIAHIRVTDRTDADGKRVLFVEELQSDWGQEGKKRGFKTGETEPKQVGLNERDDLVSLMRLKAQERLIAAGENAKVARDVANGMPPDLAARASGMKDQYDDLLRRELADRQAEIEASKRVPMGPFVTKTEGWLNLGLKRVIKMAVDGDYDRVAFVTGEQSAERYDLSKQVDRIMVPIVNADGSRSVRLDPSNSDTTFKMMVSKDGVVTGYHSADQFTGKTLDEVIGKEMADKVMRAEAGTTLEGDGLKVGGEGMKAFYDKIVPNAVKALVKKLGGRMTQVSVNSGVDTDTSEIRWSEDADGINTIEWDGGERQFDTEEEARVFRDSLISNRSMQPGFDITPEMRDNAGPGLPLFSRRSQLPGNYQLRDFGKAAVVVESIQDRYNRWKQAIEDVRSQGGTITEANDFYAAEERYWGTVGAAMDDFKDELQQFAKDVAADKLKLQDVALYAYAKHAQERNDWIAAQRPGMPDGGSGMPTADAMAILMDAKMAGLDQELEKHAATLQRWIQGTRDLMFNKGLISQEEYDSWSNMFQDYVPLRGLEGMPEKQGTGQGFNIKGREGKAAKGRYSEAKNIIEQIVQDRTRALIRAGKNDVLKSFARFVLDNPSPNLWEINAVERKPVDTVDANGNRIIDEQDTIITDDRTVTVKDAGEEIHILVVDDRLREQLQNLHIDNVGKVVGSLLMVNRLLGQLYTAFNPVFTVLNASRDIQAATIGMIDEVGFMASAKLLAKLPIALKESYMAEAGTYSPDYQLYRATGGKTGFFDFKNVERQEKELASFMSDAERGVMHPMSVAKTFISVVEAANGGIENATRLAAFKVAREEGKSVAEAARISKNITVNFNRKGALTPALSAWFLFFNPAVQGTARIVQALKSRKVQATLGFAMAGVFALAMRNAAAGDDDDGVAWWDKIPDEVKERNLIIVLPHTYPGGEKIEGTKTGRYIKVPMPYGYNFFAVLANQAADLIRNSRDKTRGRGMADAIGKSLNALLGAWMPLPELAKPLGDAVSAALPGGKKMSEEAQRQAALSFVPDALNPLGQAALNVSSFGRKLYPDDQQSLAGPDSSRYFPAQAGTIWQRAAEGMNAATGGSRYRSGVLDFTPATLETLARSYGGGPAGFTLDVLNAAYARQSIERKDIDPHRMPFIKQLYGVIDAETDRMLGYQRMSDVDGPVSMVKRAQREGAGEKEIEAIKKDAGSIINLGNTLEVTREQMSMLRKEELQAISSDKLSEAEKYQKLQDVARRRRVVLQNFNAAYNREIKKAEEEERLKRAGRLNVNP